MHLSIESATILTCAVIDRELESYLNVSSFLLQFALPQPDRELQGYHRTVLLLHREQDHHDVAFALQGGLAGAIDRLRPVSGPSDEEGRATVGEIIQALKAARDKSKAYKPPARQIDSAVVALLDVAVTWKDPAMWQQVLFVSLGSFSKVGKDRVTRGLTAFGFSSIQEGYVYHLLPVGSWLI
jgi:hypothetical protein